MPARAKATPLPVLGDILGPGLDVVFCGINPAVSAAQSGHHFSHRSNRFWRTLYQAGFTPHQLAAEDDHSMLRYRCGLTSAVERATVRADELRASEFRDGAEALRAKILHYRPRAIAFLGKPAYATIARQANLPWGRQALPFGDALAWVLPNPSGLNRQFDQAQLTAAYRELHDAVTAMPRPR